MTDQLKKYVFNDHQSRVQAVKLTRSWQTGMAHQSYPDCVQRLLGELMSAAVLLAGNIKFDGSVVLQLQGEGAVALIVVECDAELSIRATATLREGRELPPDGTLQSLMNVNDKGRFIVVLDPGRSAKHMQPYQGVVPLEGDSVAEALEHYMRTSEQLDTRLWLAADGNQSAGLLVQRLPGQGGNNVVAKPGDPDAESSWDRAVMLANTVTADELLSLDIDQLIHRLFWEESLIAFEPNEIRWHCPCSRERVSNMLRTLGKAEIDSVLAERGSIEVSCNFCGKPYHFDRVDCAGLFLDQANTPPSDSESVH